MRLREVLRDVVQFPGGRAPLLPIGVNPGQEPAQTRGNPAVVIDRAVAEHLEVLGRPHARGIRVVEGVGEAQAVHPLLGDAGHLLGNRQAGGLQDRRVQVGHIEELRAHLTLPLDTPGPGYDHRISSASKVRAHALAPLEGRVTGPGPAGRIMGRARRAAQGVQSGEHFGGGFRETVHLGHRVRGARQVALEARAVVAGDVDHEGVVEFTQVLESVDHPADLVVRLSVESGEDLHEPSIHAALVRGERVPGRQARGPRRQVSVLGHNPQLLLAEKDLLAVPVPAHVKGSSELVDPGPGSLQRGVGRSRGVIHEEGLVRGEGLLTPDPVDCLGGQVLVQGVVVFAADGRSHRDRLGAQGEFRIPLVGLGSDKSVVEVESLARGPVVKGTREGCLRIRDQVPLAQGRGGVAIEAEHLGDHGGTPRNRTGVPGIIRAPIGNGPHAHRVAVASGEEGRSGRRAHRGHVEARVAQAMGCETVERGRGDQPAKGAGLPESGVIQQNDQDIGRPRRSP